MYQEIGKFLLVNLVKLNSLNYLDFIVVDLIFKLNHKILLVLIVHFDSKVGLAKQDFLLVEVLIKVIFVCCKVNFVWENQVHHIKNLVID